jgi:hypothetical protein
VVWSGPKMTDPGQFAWLLVVAALTVLGCQPKIGDSCNLATDCSESGDRICDDTVPGGYCTTPNCEPDSCAEEAACIGFRQSASSLGICEDPNQMRTLRTFCMFRCSNDGDCRGGYACVDMSVEDNEYDAIVADTKNSHSKVCVVPYSAVAASTRDEDVAGEYCTAGAYEDDGTYDVEVASGGQGGMGGEAGASGTVVDVGGASSGGASSGGASSGGASVEAAGSAGEGSAGAAGSSNASGSGGV